MVIKIVDYIWFNGEMILWVNVIVYVFIYVMYYGILVFEGVCCYNILKGFIIFCYCEYV